MSEQETFQVFWSDSTRESNLNLTRRQTLPETGHWKTGCRGI